ncbi:MAG: tetratricopeptide repeat protein [Pseudomonadota bacterium]
MLKPFLVIAGLALVAGCSTVDDKQDPLAGDIIDEIQVGELLLTTGDPRTAVSYYESALSREPERVDFRRNLARAYVRASRLPEAARTYQELDALGAARAEDRLEYAMVAVRLGRWDDANALATGLPTTMDTPRRYVLEAMLADRAAEWERADAAYATAEQLSPNPAEVLNNWGVSLMSRGELQRASGTFERAVSYDSSLFSAKNNLAISRGLRGEYRLPLVPMTSEERAVITYNLGLIALRKGQTRLARGLFASAIDTHPRYYQSAVDQLAQLDGSVIQ